MSEALGGASAAEALIVDKDALARAVTRRQYDEAPELIDRHGERGREKTLQDMRYNIEHLIPAVDLGRPAMFAEYVRWLVGVLLARGVATRYVKRCLELLDDECRTRYEPRVADAISRVIAAGLEAVTVDATA